MRRTLCRHTEAGKGRCIEASVPTRFRGCAGVRDKCPVSTRVGEPAGPAETRVTGKHDRLITVFDANLLEDPGDMIADRFLRELKRPGDLRIIEALGNALEHGPFAQRQLVKWQSVAGRATSCQPVRARKSRTSATNRCHAGSSARSMWFSLSSWTKRQLGMRLASNRPSSIGATTSRSGCTIRTGHLILRRLLARRCPTHLKQADGSVGGGCSTHLLRPGAQMLPRAARLKTRRPHLQEVVVLLSPAKPRTSVNIRDFSVLVWGIRPPQRPLGVAAVEDEMAHSLGMPGRVLDCDGAAPAGAHHGKPPESAASITHSRSRIQVSNERSPTSRSESPQPRESWRNSLCSLVKMSSHGRQARLRH